MRRRRTGVPIRRTAVCVGGTARTFGHPIVYRTIRGHVLDALGGHTVPFAYLKLGDDRGSVIARAGAGLAPLEARHISAAPRRALRRCSSTSVEGQPVALSQIGANAAEIQRRLGDSLGARREC